MYNFKAITGEERKKLKSRYNKGFNVHGAVKDTANDLEVKNRLCQYMMRGLIGEKNIVYYNRKKERVVIKYKYEGHFQTERMSVYEFIARVIQHIDPITKQTRYYGVYSNRIRNRRKEAGKKANRNSKNIYRRDFKLSWRKLIWRIWEVDPLICVNCGNEMKLEFIAEPESAKWELRRLKKMKYYYQGRWSNHSPPRFSEAA